MMYKGYRFYFVGGSPFCKIGGEMKTSKELTKWYQSKEFQKEYIYDGNDLGSTIIDDKTMFKLWSPVATKVELNLYESGNEDARKLGSFLLEKGEKGVFSYLHKENLKNTYYTYTVTTSEGEKEVGDIYAKACGVNGQKSMVVDLADTNPSNWEEDQFSYDANKQPIIYELHIKDFSYDLASGISEEKRGKFVAFTEDTGKNTGVEYLKNLGVTHVHILPMYDFGSIDEAGSEEQFNWGYDPMNYNVPEGSYSTNPFDGTVRIRECKEMVQALHRAGIGVIMDVVYNHTYHTDTHFQHTVPYYYYRTKADGSFSDGSACGNETASDHEMFRNYMIQSVMYWAKEYHLDGFRFDLMGLHDTETMNQIRAELNTLENGNEILVYGEPWYADEPAMQKGCIPSITKNVAHLEKGIAIFSDATRDSIKGSVFYEEEVGYVNGDPTLAEEVKKAVLAQGRPGQIISYVSAHDNFTLYDKLVMSLNKEWDFTTKDEAMIQINKLCAGIIFTSGGAAFFQAGEEFARTKLGEGDSYKSSPLLNMLDWKRSETYTDLVEYYKNLIDFKKQSETLMDKNCDRIEKIEFIEQVDKNIVSFVIKDDIHKFVVYNPYSEEVQVQVPEGKWNLISDGNLFMEQGREIVIEKTYLANSSSAIILEKI